MLTNLACTMSDWETIGPLLHGTARAWRQKLDERLKPMGLSQAKWRTLLHLSLAPERRQTNFDMSCLPAFQRPNCEPASKCSHRFVRKRKDAMKREEWLPPPFVCVRTARTVMRIRIQGKGRAAASRGDLNEARAPHQPHYS